MLDIITASCQHLLQSLSVSVSEQTYLGYLLELAVGEAAFFGRLQRNLVVVHKGLVNPQLTGLVEVNRE